MSVERSGIDPPVFFIGVPRSGTTILFEAFARHPDLAWPSNYCEMKPDMPALNILRPLLDNRVVGLAGNKKQQGKVRPGNRYLPQPDEAYAFWDLITGIDFSRKYLLEETAGRQRSEYIRKQIKSVVRWQMRRRFAAKLTGPARIGYLSSVFPDAIFVHVVRDGLAVTHSLLGVSFWQEKGGKSAPFWEGGLTDGDIARWQASSRDPGVLAAIQWRRIIIAARAEAAGLPPGKYIEVRYEDFVEDPHGVIMRLAGECGLEDQSASHEFLDKGPELRNMNDRYIQQWTPAYSESLVVAMQPLYAELGYA